MAGNGVKATAIAVMANGAMEGMKAAAVRRVSTTTAISQTSSG